MCPARGNEREKGKLGNDYPHVKRINLTPTWLKLEDAVLGETSQAQQDNDTMSSAPSKVMVSRGGGGERSGGLF